MARNQKLSYKMNMFHFLTKQNYSKYSQISMSMSFSSSEASTMFRSSTASSTSESVIFSKGLSLLLSSMLVGHVPIELSMLFSRFLKASEKNAVEVKVCGKRRREVGLVIPGHYKARTKSRSHCKILDRELNYMKTKCSHFEIEHELSEERILMPYVTSSK